MTRTQVEELIETFVTTHQLEAYWCNNEPGEVRVQFLCEDEDDE